MRFQTILSLKSLITLGFVVTAIPLFLAVMYAAFAMRETAALGRAMNHQVFEQTKRVGLVLQKSSDIERKARLFVLLADPALRQPYERQSYESARAAFKQALDGLLKLHVDSKTVLLANELAEKERLIYQEIIGSDGGDGIKLPVDEAFQGLRETSNALSREFENHVEHQFNEFRQLSESQEDGLLLKGSALLLASLAFIATLLYVLSRSMRQLDAGIRRLGSHDLAEPISVSGPADLGYLGSRLEWLRTHLLELEASKRQFTHNVACEIEAPLDGIREGAERLAGGEDEASDRQDIAQALRADVEKLKTVAEELRRYSQICPAADMGLKQTVPVKDLLESAVEDFKPRLEAKSISVKMLARPVDVAGIPEQLRDIIEQILANAVKFSPTGGEIRIMLRASGAQMELEVEDEGPGIDPDERPHVFEPFFHGKAALACEAQGPGLGLAIVRDYVANHQGKVDVIDPRQAQTGARIRIQIPLAEPT